MSDHGTRITSYNVCYTKLLLDIVVIAADTTVDLMRFAGKRIYETSTKAAINDGAAVIQSALKEASVAGIKPGGLV